MAVQPNDRTTTSANVILLLSVRNFFPVPQQIQGFASDEMISTEALNNIEASIGADGRLSAGFTPAATPMTITLQADSLSNDFFEQVQAAQSQAREAFIFDGTYIMSSVGKKYDLVRGFMQGGPKFASARRTLQPRPWVITWEQVTPALT